MKLYVLDKRTNQKTYLRVVAPDRIQLSRILGAPRFLIGKNIYTVYDVSAEPSSDSTAVGGFLGGLIGAVGGAPGVFIGGLLGVLIGQNQTNKENKEAEIFNGSRL